MITFLWSVNVETDASDLYNQESEKLREHWHIRGK